MSGDGGGGDLKLGLLLTELHHTYFDYLLWRIFQGRQILFLAFDVLTKIWNEILFV